MCARPEAYSGSAAPPPLDCRRRDLQPGLRGRNPVCSRSDCRGRDRARWCRGDVMSEPVFCLRRDVVVEPLVARWHAWPHLISPVTAGLNAAYRHLRTMDSYVEVPQLHAAAARAPALQGGALVHLGGGRVGGMGG